VPSPCNTGRTLASYLGYNSEDYTIVLP